MRWGSRAEGAGVSNWARTEVLCAILIGSACGSADIDPDLLDAADGSDSAAVTPATVDAAPVAFRDGGRGDAGMRDAGRLDAGPPDSGSEWPSVRVDRVIDGDTVVVSSPTDDRGPDGELLDGRHVRLLGVDAPEIAHSSGEQSECWGEEASRYVRVAVLGRAVELEFDSRAYSDQYGRLLAYIRVGSSVLNEDLLSMGHVRVYRGATHKYFRRYVTLESSAKSALLGLWGCSN